MAFYKSKFTGEEIDQRLTQGTYDDAVKAGFKGTKEAFYALLGQLQETTDAATVSQPAESDKLETFNKNIVDAINELHQELQTKPDASNFATKTELNGKQDTLVSGTNIKTLNGVSLLGEGDIQLDEGSDPYEINLTNLLSAEDSESISTAIGGIDNLNATVQDNRIIVGTIANGSVSVSIRILGNVTTLYYLLDSVVGLTLNEVAITNTSGTLSKRVTTHAVLTENMVINSLTSDETTLPLSAAQGKVLNEKIENKLSGVYYTNMLLSIDFTSSNLTDDDINQYIGSWDELVAAIHSNTPIFDKIKLEGQSGSQYTIIPVVAGMSSDTAVDLAMFVGVDKTYRQIKIVKTADNNYTLVSAKKVILDYDNNADLLTDNKTVIGAINENLASIRKLDKAAGQPVIKDVDLSVYDEENLYWTVGGIKSSQQYYRIKYVNLNKGDLVIIQTNAGINANVICVVDSLHTKRVLDTGIVGISTLSYFSYLADKDCIVALSYTQVNTVAYIVKSSQNAAIAGIATSTAALHKIYESYGAVYNKDTGYWEMYGLTDLTEEDMYNIYIENTNTTTGSYYADVTRGACIFWPFGKARIRFITADSSYIAFDGFVFSRACNAEIFRVRDFTDTKVDSLNITGVATGLFYACSKLKDVGIIGVSQVSLFILGNIRAFYKAVALSRCLLKSLKANISFQDSPLISYESLSYLVTNAANTSAITVAVHPTTYSYLTGTAQPTAEVGGTTEEWQALVTAAQTKQISFAIPEETQSEENV